MKVMKLSKMIEGKQILNDVHFELKANEIVGLIGRNGSGKTTLFRTLTGQYLPDKGEIELDGISLLTATQSKSELFYIDEAENFLAPYTLKTINQFYRTAYPNFNQDLFLTLTGSHQLPFHVNYHGLSKGMQGLFNMILAISSNARFLLLDEPFDGLDVIVRKDVIGLLLEHISDNQRTALIASHNLNELENLADRVLLLKNQTIIKDYRLEEMRESAKKIQMVFKTKKIPSLVKEHSRLLTIQGRVITAIFEDFNQDLANKIQTLQPVLFEELPLSLEDLFEANLKEKMPR
ncbi:ABC transporter ATP-binding protein [Enterococcus durans]|uniref:ATP-binding cassette domain-containing protein n=1 Tax=Enterococcus durans TaxID=53345 RepID=UPI0009F10577|nr:ABC transporter ATP-binding protein [Enterococcus durans]MBX9042243.1 ABC transporter ATP-binding protein [Enterococcus durans]MBX9079090.1 ABC transporter ATP-binding protein [Enterococcus durans]MCB8506388.1 ABC transporter ATP-binding protein [Enterococcus durans]MCB8516232.1 ABC transporter ATP-binding protein [Enterococcus durans]OQO82413.1 multidrug ABC transporter [Enterococcus durans]